MFGQLLRFAGLWLAVAWPFEAGGDLSKDPGLLAALWDIPDPMTAFADLGRRHDFVLPLSRRLHDEVRDTLRADLLDPWRRPCVRDISQRALDLHQARLAEMRRSRPALDDQLADDGFTAALLAALWHTAWAANQDGLILFLQILPVLAVADPDTAQAAADTISFSRARSLTASATTWTSSPRSGPSTLTTYDPAGNGRRARPARCRSRFPASPWTRQPRPRQIR